jgi:hypothetical protein
MLILLNYVLFLLVDYLLFFIIMLKEELMTIKQLGLSPHQELFNLLAIKAIK